MPTAKRKKTRLTDVEYRRRQAQEARRQARKKRRRYVYTGVAGFVGLLVIMSFTIPQILQSSPNPEAGLPGYAPEYMESPRIAEGAGHEPYTSTPPASGPHYDVPADWGTYDTELLDERVLRNLHQTGVAINYNLDDQQEIERLKAFVEGQPDYPCGLILQPYSKIDAGKVAVTAWTRLDVMNGVDEERIQRFLDAFRGNDRQGSLDKADCFPEGG